jgi:hypothetical protein
MTATFISENLHAHANRTPVDMKSILCDCGLPKDAGHCCITCLHKRVEVPVERFPMKVIGVLAIGAGILLAGVIYAGWFV